MKAIINVMIYDYEHFIENGYIVFNGTIHQVGHMKDYDGHYETVDGEGMLLMPSLINGHTHIYSTLFRGSPLRANPKNFLEILEQIWWKFDSKLTLDSIKESVKAYGQDSLLHGVTCLIDHHASGQVEESLMTIHHELDKLKMKHLLCFETSDRFDIKKCIEENTMYYSHKGHFGLHAGMSLSDETLSLVSNSLRGKPIHIHVAESELDEELSRAAHDKRVVNRLDDFSLLTKDSILAHCLHIDENEAKLIKERSCVIAINPTSNLNNAVGLYKNKMIQDYKIPVLVGTDGLGVNVAKEYQNLYYVGNQSNQSVTDIGLDWIKEQIMHAYDYFNRLFGSRIGKLEKDFDSDFMLVDYNPITPINKDNILSHILFGVFEALRPQSVYIGGQRVVDAYRLVEKEAINHKVVEELWRRL